MKATVSTPVRITVTAGRLDGKPTIYSQLHEKLGREPTLKECCEEVKRILVKGEVV